MKKPYEKETICIQSGWKPKNGEPRVLPIYQSTTFKYETSEQRRVALVRSREALTVSREKRALAREYRF